MKKRKATKEIERAVQDAMALIGREIIENDGLYPFNGGRISLAEVCRRASVAPITMHGSCHASTTRVQILNWLKDRRSGSKCVDGEAVAHAGVPSFAQTTYRADLREIASRFQELYQVEIPFRDEQLAEYRARIEQLESENLHLRASMSDGKVVAIENRLRKEGR